MTKKSAGRKYRTHDNGRRIKNARRYRLVRLRLLKTKGVEDNYIKNMRTW